MVCRAGISGWIAAKSDFVTMWEDVQLPDSERYTLVWESQVPLRCCVCLPRLQPADDSAIDPVQFARSSSVLGSRSCWS